ncbi:MAG: hypothetical protein NT171_09230 [Planctomycetota bacterium]|nr:hypothetical protein [Planctomycetota bacterium]
MSTQIRLQKRQSTDLKIISGAKPLVLKQLLTAIQTMHSQPLSPQQFEKYVEASVGDSALSSALVRQLISLSGMRRNLSISSSEVIAGLDFGIRNDSPEWEAGIAESWREAKLVFEEMLSEQKVVVLSKAVELSYDYANLLRSARIVTDIRPVFGDDASAIAGVVISYTLRLAYDSADGQHSLSLALDSNDLKQMISQCERAAAKGVTAKKAMTDPSASGIPTIITGQDLK